MSEPGPPTNLIEELIATFRLERKQSFNPTSVWFSYGSNLDGSYFESKMKKIESSLTLQGVSKATLRDFRRTLDNCSSQHGLAYAIHCQKGECVQGITHEVPCGELGKFLRMEGVLGTNYELRKLPSYRVIEVDAESMGGPSPAFSLEGNQPCAPHERQQVARSKYKELKEYIEVSERGAKAQSIDPTPFTNDLKWLKSSRSSSTRLRKLLGR
jgi:hypothetical protein